MYIKKGFWVSFLWGFAKCNGDNNRDKHLFEERTESYKCDNISGDNAETLERIIGQCCNCGILEDNEIFYLNS